MNAQEVISYDDARSLSMVLRAQQGDAQAAEWLYHRFRCRVLSLMHRIVGRQDAEDLTQQCFLTLLRRIGGFAGKSSFWTWFYRLAVNEALQHLRRNQRRPHVTVPVEHLAAPERDPVEDREAVEHALAGLPDPQRLAIQLHFQDGLSYKEIAQQLSIPMGTVGSRINQAKAVIAKSVHGDRQGSSGYKSSSRAA